MTRLDDLHRQILELTRGNPKTPPAQRIFDKRADIQRGKTGDAERCVACMRKAR